VPAITLDDTVLTVDDLSKSYGGTRVLANVGMSVNRHEIHSLVGGNGSGKSTLIKVLAGVVPADSGGQVSVGGRSVPAGRWTPHDARAAHLRFVHQDLGLFANLSIAENLCIGAGFDTSAIGRVRWRRVDEHSRELLRRHGVDADPRTPLGELRPAEQSIIAIARALQGIDSDEVACIVLDEPTAALPRHDAERLLRLLRSLASRGHGIVLVTHHLDEVLTASDRVTVLRDGQHIHTGPTNQLDRATLIDLIVGPATGDLVPHRRTGSRPGEPLLRTTDLHIGRAESISLEVHGGEIVGLAGLPASGCEDILRALFGLARPANGEMWLDHDRHAPRDPAEAMRAGVALVPGDRLHDGVFAELSVLENVTAASTAAAGRWRLHHRRERRGAHALLRQYRVRPPELRRPIQTLSGGNQQKALLARWAARRPRLLLLEDPTCGVDIGARSDIWNLLHERARSDGLAIMVTSSDLEELAWQCDRVVVMGGGRVHAQLSGDDLNPAQLTGAVYEAAATTAVAP
jgi:ribose transport system ATP-binding protein